MHLGPAHAAVGVHCIATLLVPWKHAHAQPCVPYQTTTACYHTHALTAFPSVSRAERKPFLDYIYPSKQTEDSGNPRLSLCVVNPLTERHKHQLRDISTAHVTDFMVVVVWTLSPPVLEAAAGHWRVWWLRSSVWEAHIETPSVHAAALSDNPSCGDTQTTRAKWRAMCAPVIMGRRRRFVSQPCGVFRADFRKCSPTLVQSARYGFAMKAVVRKISVRMKTTHLQSYMTCLVAVPSSRGCWK